MTVRSNTVGVTVDIYSYIAFLQKFTSLLVIKHDLIRLSLSEEGEGVAHYTGLVPACGFGRAPERTLMQGQSRRLWGSCPLPPASSLPKPIFSTRQCFRSFIT